MSDEIYKALGERVRRAREQLGLSQHDLALKLGYSSPATISLYEAGLRKIGVADLQRVARILGMPIDALLEEPAEDSIVDELCLRFRALEVRPTARDSVRAFISFAAKNAAKSSLPALGRLTPGHAAQRIRELAKIHECPVSPRAIATGLGVPVFEWGFPDEISGIVFACRELMCIGVNENHPRVRQRFTIAHEIGHLVFDQHEELIFDFFSFDLSTHPSSPDVISQEIRANQFAADLLMPMDYVREDVNKHGLDVAFLARRYEVSQQAMWFRLLSLKLAHPDQKP